MFVAAYLFASTIATVCFLAWGYARVKLELEECRKLEDRLQRASARVEIELEECLRLEDRLQRGPMSKFVRSSAWPPVPRHRMSH